jgi:hypothetical protein
VAALSIQKWRAVPQITLFTWQKYPVM